MNGHRKPRKEGWSSRVVRLRAHREAIQFSMRPLYLERISSGDHHHQALSQQSALVLPNGMMIDARRLGGLHDRWFVRNNSSVESRIAQYSFNFDELTMYAEGPDARWAVEALKMLKIDQSLGG